MHLKVSIVVISTLLPLLVNATNYCPNYDPQKKPYWDVIFIMQASQTTTQTGFDLVSYVGIRHFERNVRHCFLQEPF